MNRRQFLIGGGTAAIVLATGGYLAFRPSPDRANVITLGWQPPWANQGQIVEVLRTGVARQILDTGIELKPFTFGGPMAEAALAGRLDVIFLGDHPATKLISKGTGWKIVSRLTNYRSAILIPPDSTIRDMGGLRGKKIGTAIGSTTHRDSARVLSQAGILTPRDATFVNIDQAEHSSVMAAGATNSKWGDLDAIATYDPTAALAVEMSIAKTLTEWPSLGVVAASQEMLTSRRADLGRFLADLREAYTTYAENPSAFDAQYAREAGLSLDQNVLHQLTLIEPNLSMPAASNPTMKIEGSEMETFIENVRIAKSLELLPSDFQINAAFDFAVNPD